MLPWLKAICKCAVVHISTWKPVKSLNRETLTGSGWFLPNSCWLLVGSLWVSGCFWLVPGVFWLVLVGLCFFNLWHMLKKCLLSIVTYHTKYFFVMHVLNRKKSRLKYKWKVASFLRFQVFGFQERRFQITFKREALTNFYRSGITMIKFCYIGSSTRLYILFSNCWFTGLSCRWDMN